MASNLKEPLQDAAEEVKATASDAVDTVASQATSATVWKDALPSETTVLVSA